MTRHNQLTDKTCLCFLSGERVEFRGSWRDEEPAGIWGCGDAGVRWRRRHSVSGSEENANGVSAGAPGVHGAGQVCNCHIWGSQFHPFFFFYLHLFGSSWVSSVFQYIQQLKLESILRLNVRTLFIKLVINATNGLKYRKKFHLFYLVIWCKELLV